MNKKKEEEEEARVIEADRGGPNRRVVPLEGAGSFITLVKRGSRGISPWAMRPELKICASAQRILQFLEKKISSL